jgi:hypothetical protein
MISRTQPRTTGSVGRGPSVVRAAFDLQEGERHGREHDVMRPALIGAAFEVIEAEVVLQLAILLLDGPAAARERDQVDERRRRGEVQQVVLADVGRRAFAEQPAFAAAAVGRTRSAQNRAVSGPAVPVPQVTVSQASSGAESASAMAD